MDRARKEVHDVVDGGGLYFSRVAVAGQYAFLGGVATDADGVLDVDARVAPPYDVSPPAHVVMQTRYIFNRYKKLLNDIGSDINQMLQVEQYIPHKSFGDGSIDVSRGKGFMDRNRPTSALVCTGDLMPGAAVINPTGIALIPREGVSKEIPGLSAGYHDPLRREQFGVSYEEEGPFNEVVAAGPYVFTVGDIALNWQSGDIEQEVKVPEYVFWGSEIRNEADFLLSRLETYLGRVDADLGDVVHTTVYLYEIEDLFELDRVWRRRFPENPPARTVVPVRGLGAPRREARGLGHGDIAVRMEHLTKAIRPGFGAKKEAISTGADPLQHESEAIRAGDLLWISGQFAGGVDGLRTAPDAASQVDYLFGRLAEICRAGGTTLDNLVRLRAFVTNPGDAYTVYSALKAAVPVDPPSVVVSGVPGPLQVPGCTVVLDGVAYAPA